MHIACTRGQELRRSLTRDERLAQRLPFEQGMRDADIIHEQLPRRIRPRAKEMPHLRQTERECTRRAYGSGCDPPRIRLHAARHINRHHRLCRRIDLLNQAQDRRTQRAMRPRTEDAVHNRIGEPQRDTQPIPVAVTHERTDLHAHRTQRIVHCARRLPETLLLTCEEQLHTRPHIHEMARRCKGIAAVIPAAGKDNERLVRCAADHRGSLLRRPPSRILHQGDCRQPVVLHHLRINTAHILCKRYIHR